MRTALIMLVLLGGCGRVGFDSARGGIGGSGGDDDDITTGGHTVSAQTAYLKPSNTAPNDYFGIGMAMSADGMTLAVGADGDASAATGVGGAQTGTGAPQSGAVHVFVASGTTWAEQAYLKASNTGTGDAFGIRIALSGDGNTLAVSALEEASAATGINGNQASNTAASAGAVYVFSRSGGKWAQQAYIKASNTGTGDRFGEEIALSNDGNTLAVGAQDEDSAATWINGNQADNSAVDSGAVYVFARSGTTWTQQAYVKASNTEAKDWFGIAIALSGDGNTLAVGAISESSAATTIGGDQTSNGAPSAGAAYVFTRAGTTWTQQAYLKASNAEAYDFFGGSLALSSTGDTLAVAALGESGGASGVGGNPADNTEYQSGAVYVFARAGAAWAQQAYVKPSNTRGGMSFGGGLALSGDGDTLAVGAADEASSATGLDANQADTSMYQAGAVYVFGRSGARWRQHAYIKASNTDAGDSFGGALAMSADAATLAVSAVYEASSATGVDGDQASNAAVNAGAVYVFR